MITIRASVTDNASPMLARLIDSLTGEESSQLNQVAGFGVVAAASKYHRDFDAAGRWRGPRYMGGGQVGQGGDFGSRIAGGWFVESHDRRGVTVENAAPLFRHKVLGGTITAKRARFLTIPLVPEARGRRVRDYEIFARVRLFRRGGALFERVKSNVVGERGRRRRGAGASSIRTSEMRAVYALRRSVTQAPWPGAMPPEKLLSDAYVSSWRNGLADMLEG